jgi:predicted nucleic acid-binding protein
VPDFIFAELSKYQEEIIKRTKLKEQFASFVRDLFSEITVIPNRKVMKKLRNYAET